MLVDNERGNEKSFDSKEEAEEKRNDLISLGASPEQLEIVKTDGGTETNGNEQTVESDGVEAEVVDLQRQSGRTIPRNVETADAKLPNRELTDDPIEWMQQGSGEFTTTIKGQTVITKKGFRVLQHRYDISTGSEIIVGPEETDHEFCRVKAWAEMPGGQRAEAHASAHVDRGDDHYLLTSMADTRAKSRALSDITGVGAVAVEEMAGVDNGS